MLISTKLIIRERELDTRQNLLHVYIYISHIYTFTRTSMHGVRTDSGWNTPGIYIYIPTYWGLRFGGTPSTRLDLRLFNSSACQKHQCTLCSLIVLFPFLSFSVFRPFSLVLSFSDAEPTISFSLFLPLASIYFPSASLPSLPSSRYNYLLSLVLSNHSSFQIFHLRSTRCYPSFGGRQLPSGWRTIRSNTLR